MTIRRVDDLIRFEGTCPAEDAETLLGLLQESDWTAVDISGCGRMHSAVVQLLLAAAPPVRGIPADPFMREWISSIIAYVYQGGATANAADPL